MNKYTFIWLERGDETRRVLVREDGSYRIIHTNVGVSHGKRHENFDEYYKNITAKGWHKVRERKVTK